MARGDASDEPGTSGAKGGGKRAAAAAAGSRAAASGKKGAGKGPAPKRGGKGAAAGSSKRGSTKIQVKKSFPWGFASGVAVVAVLLVGILVYAVVNTGAGFQTAADKLDDGFDGIRVTRDHSANHTTAAVAYADRDRRPPDGGNHNPIPQTCTVYDAPIVAEHAMHSLEHGAVWITYRPDLPADQVATLTSVAQANPSYRMLSPYPGLESPVSLQAWGRSINVDSASDPQVERFADGYSPVAGQGPQTREPGATCAGVDLPGTTPFVQAGDGSFIPLPEAGDPVPQEGDIPDGSQGSAPPGSTPSAPVEPTAPAATATVPAPAPAP